MPRTSVLIVDGDLFEANYVAAVLIDRGIDVVGPIADPSAARDAIRARSPQAAVIARISLCADNTEVVDELDRVGIPYLTLLRASPRCPTIDKPILTAPFAAYQVADWVVEAVRGG